jgi:hypothetical protein
MLTSGNSPGVVGSNIRELHTGGTYARTKDKFGAKKANKQAVAIALNKARESGPIPGAGHNPPKPVNSKPVGKILPRHLAGKGLISEAALAKMGNQEAVAAKPAVGKRVAKAGKSRAAHKDAGAALPEVGKKKPPAALPPDGEEIAEQV